MDEAPIEGPDAASAEVEGSPSSRTGDTHVDAILTVLEDLDDELVTQHAARYLEVHAMLSNELNPAAGPRGAGAHGPA